MSVYAGIRESSSKLYLQDSRIKFFYINFSKPESYLKRLESEQFDHIIHNAGVVRALKNDTFYQVNTHFTETFLATITSALPHLKTFCYISSIAACGSADTAGLDALTPDMPPSPPTHYGKSKLKAENLVKESQLPYLIFRPTAVYGPRDQDILKLFKGVKVGIAPLIGAKKSILSFVYVKDLVRLIIQANLSTIRDKTYVVSDGKDYEGNTFHKAVAKVMGKKAIYPKIPMQVVSILGLMSEWKSRLTNKADTFNLDKVNELKARNWSCDITELEKDFNFAPYSTISESLRETYQWYQNNNWI
jgi:nucleoside-diphosphate-sugar epimerase